MGKKKTENVPATSDSSEMSVKDMLLKAKSFLENTNTEMNKEAKDYEEIYDFFIVKPYMWLLERGVTYEKILAENNKAEYLKKIDEVNAATLATVEGLTGFHKNWDVFSVEEYIDSIESEKRDEVYQDIIKGGDWFWKYCVRNIRANLDKGFNNSKVHYPVGIYGKTLSERQKEVTIMLPPYEPFKDIKQIKFNEEENTITEEELEDNAPKDVYRKFVLSLLLQVMSVALTCNKNVHKSGAEYPMDSITAVGVKGFFDDCYGTDAYLPVVSATMPKEELGRINFKRVNPEKFITKILKAEIFTDMLDTDIYEEDIIKNHKKQIETIMGRGQKKPEKTS